MHTSSLTFMRQGKTAVVMQRSGLCERPRVPRPCEADQARRLNEVRRYVEERGLQSCAESLCVDALRDPRAVPVNPYPAFTQRLRQLAQERRLTLDKSSSDEMFSRAVSFPTTLTAVRHVAGAKGCSHVWGLPSILRCVSPQEIGRYRWLLEDTTPPLSKLGHHSPYTVQVACALTGPCIFSGTLLPASPAPDLDLLQTYIIAGPDPHRARSLYAQYLHRDVIRMTQQGRHSVLRITVPDDVKGGVQVFSKEEVSLQGAVFEDAVQRCLDWDREELVRVECVWRVDPQGTQYQGGSKAYCLTIIQNACDHQEKERVLSCPQRPLLLLCCSVFPQQAQAEAFARAHLPARPDSGVDVFAPVRDVLAGRLSALHLPHEALPAAHLCCTLLLLLQDVQPSTDSATPQTSPLEALRQLFGFVWGPAGRLRGLRQHALRLRRLVQLRPAEAPDAEACVALARQLQRLLRDCAVDADPLGSCCRGNPESLRSHSRLEAACDQLARDPSHAAALAELTEWCWSSSVLECQLVSDALPGVPLLKGFMRRAGHGEEGTQEQEDAEQRALWEMELLYCKPHTVDLTPETCGDPARLKARLSQYLVDCAVDQCWEQCLWKVLSLSPLPFNPFPSLAQEFRLAALRTALWRQPDAEVLKQMWSLQTPQPCPAGGPLHRGPGGEGYGLPSALRASNPDRLRDCLARAQSLETEPQPTGRFKVERSTAVLSPSAWLGMLSPFLCGLQVVEFCYITAPPGCLDEVLQVYAKLVLAGLSELRGKDGLILDVVDLGSRGMWDMQQVTSFPTHFQECFADALRHRHPVHLRAFQAPRGGAEWRFLALRKRFVLYCLREDGSAWLCLPQHDPLSLRQAVFASPERAALHFNTVGRDPPIGGSLQEVMSQLDSEITDAFLKREILQGYRLVALRGLLSGEEARLADCWRVCRSVCAQTELLCAVADCLQGLFELCGEDEASGPRRTVAKYLPAIEHMFEGFSWMLRRTLEHPEALVPPGVWEVVLKGREAVAWGSRAVWVRGMVGVCHALSETLSQDLHSLCPGVQALLERLHAAQERDTVRAHISCVETVPQNPPVLSHRTPERSVQSPDRSTPLTGAQALALF
ncbi:uncharacterized protein LOC118220656 isoform X3 [Anguilla anguilla]|uniref:uncharacterized protein LOC118220656 isoform X3 n=1 Tax=Anguilla anguilla TaxID=7936 RepID=UPI0015A8AC18|nr:uncharacterized protein LOC118220656 isoform X3 [Anguilla anguilla]